MAELLSWAYPWIKVGHLVSLISWMAGMFYLPRLFVYHAERAAVGSELDETFQIMERKLYKLIMNPAMISTWVFGLLLMATPGVVDWASAWFYIKLVAVLGMSAAHGWMAGRIRAFADGTNDKPGRHYRIMNEVPTILMLIIVVMVVVRPF
nr:protoporphyrinogen oxidase HemJ [Shimia ponticola]